MRRAFVGDRVEVLVEGPGGQLTVELPSGGTLPEEGTAIAVAWRPQDNLIFPPDAA